MLITDKNELSSHHHYHGNAPTNHGHRVLPPPPTSLMQPAGHHNMQHAKSNGRNKNPLKNTNHDSSRSHMETKVKKRQSKCYFCTTSVYFKDKAKYGQMGFCVDLFDFQRFFSDFLRLKYLESTISLRILQLKLDNLKVLFAATPKGQFWLPEF